MARKHKVSRSFAWITGSRTSSSFRASSPPSAILTRRTRRSRAWHGSCVGLLAICLVASSNYVINEVLDAPFGPLHPIKRNRPVPSGRSTFRSATSQWIALMVVGVGARRCSLERRSRSTLLALWVMGCIYNIPPVRSKDVPYVDVLVRGGQQPAAHAGGLVHRSIHDVRRAGVAAAELLDGRLLLHGDQAVRRVPRHRRSRARGGVSQVVRLLHARAAAGLDHVLRLGRDAVPWRVRHALSARADSRVPAVALVMAIYLASPSSRTARCSGRRGSTIQRGLVSRSSSVRR